MTTYHGAVGSVPEGASVEEAFPVADDRNADLACEEDRDEQIAKCCMTEKSSKNTCGGWYSTTFIPANPAGPNETASRVAIETNCWMNLGSLHIKSHATSPISDIYENL